MKNEDHQERLVQALRERLLEGKYAANQKLTETGLASDLGVSRTLVRIALASLEHEGLVVRAPNRGFRVKAFTLDQVADAIAVRGELEAMAARLAAEKGLSKSNIKALQQHLQIMDSVLQRKLGDVQSRAQWIELNGQFHTMILDFANNAALTDAVSNLGKIPLVSSRAIVFDSVDQHHSLTQIQMAHQDHHNVFNAILQRQGTRAGSIMREHAERSKMNKQVSFASMHNNQYQPEIPGLKLVSD